MTHNLRNVITILSKSNSKLASEELLTNAQQSNIASESVSKAVDHMADGVSQQLE